MARRKVSKSAGKRAEVETFKLSMVERYNLQSILPSQARREHHYLLDDLRRELLPDATENELLGTTTRDGKAVQAQFWAWNSVPPKEIEICATLLKMIRSRLEELDKEAKLERWACPLYDRFVLGKDPEPEVLRGKKTDNDSKQLIN